MKKNIFELRPTQFTLGMREVEEKVKKIKKMNEKELHEYLHSHPVPVVICSDGNAHLIDHHHLVRACWEAGVDHVIIEIKDDFSDHSQPHFWDKMKDSKWVHLYDQFGKGPHEPHQLPFDIRGLADDLYRSLAWMVREEGGFEKTGEPFSEFKWADFFRKHIQIPRTPDGFEKAIKEAMKLVHSPEAKNLPGYKGK